MSRPASLCSSIRRDGLVVDERVHHVVQRVRHDLAHRGDVPAADQLGHEVPHLLHLVVVGAADHVDELGVRRAQHRAPGDQPARLERLAERHGARLGDDRLVEVEEGRRAEQRGGHGSIVGIQQVSTGTLRNWLVHRSGPGPARRSGTAGIVEPWTDHSLPPGTPRSPTSWPGSLRRPARPLEVASSADAVLRCWASAPVVLVGADLAAELVELAPSRRPGVQVVAWAPVPSGTFRDALLVGAERVVELPVGAEFVAELLTDLGEAGRAEGVPLGVVGGSGGAGATTFACALGQVAAARGPTLVVDLDPLGAGLRPGPGPRRDGRGPVGLAGQVVGAAQRPVAAGGGPAPRRARRARVAARARCAHSTPARSARPCRPGGAATTSWWSTCPAPPTRWRPRRWPGARWWSSSCSRP